MTKLICPYCGSSDISKVIDIYSGIVSYVCNECDKVVKYGRKKHW